MKITNVIHKGLRRFIEHDDASELQPAVVDKIRRIDSFLQDMETEDELRMVRSRKAHIRPAAEKAHGACS
jgi:proteic killer suppression protein